ncbi:MAG TPA: ABC transporter permease, partial [Ignavibacteriaceae bacterium]|nr:ABC transporter permease [Ignavibacteriaceae bacterium]
MNKKESFLIGIRGLLSNKTRAALTMLGIIFGVAAVIAMMSIGEGARQETLQQIELLGTNNIIVNKLSKVSKSSDAKASYSAGLTLKDAEAIKELNPLVESVTPLREDEMSVSYKTIIEEFKIIGTTSSYPETFNTKVLEGSFFKDFHS